MSNPENEIYKAQKIEGMMSVKSASSPGLPLLSCLNQIYFQFPDIYSQTNPDTCILGQVIYIVFLFTLFLGKSSVLLTVIHWQSLN